VVLVLALALALCEVMRSNAVVVFASGLPARPAPPNDGGDTARISTPHPPPEASVGCHMPWFSTRRWPPACPILSCSHSVTASQPAGMCFEPASCQRTLPSCGKGMARSSDRCVR